MKQSMAYHLAQIAVIESVYDADIKLQILKHLIAAEDIALLCEAPVAETASEPTTERKLDDEVLF